MTRPLHYENHSGIVKTVSSNHPVIISPGNANQQVPQNSFDGAVDVSRIIDNYRKASGHSEHGAANGPSPDTSKQDKNRDK